MYEDTDKSLEVLAIVLKVANSCHVQRSLPLGNTQLFTC